MPDNEHPHNKNLYKKFNGQTRWEFSSDTLVLTFDYEYLLGKKKITCLVSREALGDLAEVEEPTNEDEALKILKKHWRKIFRAIDFKIMIGAWESGMIMIRSPDLQRSHHLFDL